MHKDVSNFRVSDAEFLITIAKYLAKHQRLQYVYEWQQEGQGITVYTDNDWAKNTITRKSTSGGCILLGRRLLKHWAKQQTVIATSSGEAELYAMCKGSAEALGVQSLLSDFRQWAQIHLCGDSTAAIGICQRQGLGKLRHLHVSDLWIQDAVLQKRINLHKVDGKLNPADVFIKLISHQAMIAQLQFIGAHFVEGRARIAPELADGSN